MIDHLKSISDTFSPKNFWRFKIAYTGGRKDTAKAINFEQNGEESPLQFLKDSFVKFIDKIIESNPLNTDETLCKDHCGTREIQKETTTLLEKLNRPVTENLIKNDNDIKNSKYYATIFESTSGELLYAFKWVGSSWTLKNAHKRAFFLKNENLCLSEDKDLFIVSPQIDFLVYNDNEFIFDVENYRRITGYHEDLSEIAYTAYEELEELSIVTDSTLINEYVGHNRGRLARVHDIIEKGFYKDSVFLKNLINNNERLGFNFRIENNKIIPEVGKVKDLITALCDRRLTSLNTDRTYDATSTHEIS